MSDDDLIRRGDIGPRLAEAGFGGEFLQDAITALPARGVEVDAVLDAAHSYLMEQYGSSPLGHPADRARIRAALEPAALAPTEADNG